MDKYNVLKEIFAIENISSKILKCSKINEDLLLEVLSKDSYNLKEDLSITASTVSRYVKILFPDKLAGNGKICNYLLHKYGYKHCKHCSQVKESEYFYNNSSYSDGLSTYCKNCQADLEKPTSVLRSAKYRAAKLQRIPNWVTPEELLEIDKFYKECPKGFQVDHVYPLQGDFVSGLHVRANLQYLTASENASKRNKFTPL
jgi:hypothetical protein